MLQLAGVLLVFNSLAIAGWWLANQKPGISAIVGLCLIACFVGCILIFNERVTEVTFTKLGTIKAAALEATVAAKEISDLKDRMSAQSATVDLVAQKATEAMRLTEELKEKNASADRKLEALDRAVEFHKTVLAVQADSRIAFDQLVKWAKDETYEFRTEANEVRETILASFDTGIRTAVSLVDPPNLSLAEVKGLFAAQPTRTRRGLVDWLWHREGISKRDKMEFLVFVLTTDPNLSVVGDAGSFFESGSQLKCNPIEVEPQRKWWEENKDKIPEF